VTTKEQCKRTDMADFSLVATCFSEKHSFRVGTNLVKALKDLGVVFKV
jgi:hypothetical protein